MANLMDYIAWRGDLPFETDPFNEVDALIFSYFSYLPFTTEIPAAFDRPVLMNTIASPLYHRIKAAKKGEIPGDANEKAELIRALAKSVRFGHLPVCGFREKLEKETEVQFAALTVCLPDGPLAVYRGTDNTLTGWKEDFNMGFLFPVPAQTEAVAYLEEMAVLPGILRTTGHSKGGNLAVCAAAFSDAAIRDRVSEIINCDGPGFQKSVLEKPEYKEVCARVTTFVPQSSIFGMLLSHEETYQIIHSEKLGGISQHDPSTWCVTGKHFVPETGMTKSSQIIEQTLKKLIYDLSTEQKKQAADAIFGIISKTGYNTIHELAGNWYKVAPVVIKEFSHLDEQTRKQMNACVKVLLGSFSESFKAEYQSENQNKEMTRA